VLYVGKYNDMIDHNSKKHLLGMCIQYICQSDYDDDEYYVMASEAVKQDGLALKWIQNKTVELCEIALEQNGMALEYINKIDMYNDYEDLCMIAIESEPFALQYIEEQTYEMCMEAVKKKWACDTACQKTI
jgi:hypothetical protein